MTRPVITFFAALCVFPTMSGAQLAPEPSALRVLSSNGVRAPLNDAQAAIELAIGHPLDIEFSTAASLAKRIRAGEAFDVVILTPAIVEALAGQHLVAPEPQLTFARTGVGVGARAGRFTAQIRTVEDFRTLLLAAESVAFTAEGQSRRTIDAAFDRLGITEAMLAKAVILGPGEAPLAVAAGDADIVLTLISEILPVPGIELVGAFPEEVQGYVRFAAALAAGSTNEPAAAAFADQLTGAAMSTALPARGLEPLVP